VELPTHRMTEVTKGLPTKSAKIRALHGSGFSRRQIADFLGIRYQFVRNVLVDEERRRKVAGAGSVAAPSEAGASPISGSAKVQLDAEGRVSIPQHIRDRLSLREGDTLIASLEGDEVRLLTIPAAVRRAQAIVRQFVPEDVSLVQELLDERRQEVERESQDAQRGP
jgi:AbrB family looped-hinge helix DNA binding protein